MKQDNNPARAYLRPFELDVELIRTAPDRVMLRWTISAEKGELQLFFDGKAQPRIPLTSSLQELVILVPPEAYLQARVRLGRREWQLAERILPLEGAHNFRDLGGYPARDGKMVRWGRVFRSESLTNLTQRDQVWLRRHFDLKLICDFRGNTERAAALDKLEGITLLPLPMEPGTATAALSRNRDLGASYIEWIEEKGESVYLPWFTQLADVRQLPLVFHCTAGKDRTGVAAALLLGLLGVSRKNIVADYALTNLSYPQLLASVKKNPTYAPMVEQLLPLLIANPVWMEATLAHIDRTYGSVENYILQKVKLSPALLQSIRRNLLV